MLKKTLYKFSVYFIWVFSHKSRRSSLSGRFQGKLSGICCFKGISSLIQTFVDLVFNISMFCHEISVSDNAEGFLLTLKDNHLLEKGLNLMAFSKKSLFKVQIFNRALLNFLHRINVVSYAYSLFLS